MARVADAAQIDLRFGDLTRERKAYCIAVKASDFACESFYLS